MSYYINRILNNKVKFIVILLFFFLPVLDIIMTVKKISIGASVVIPELTTFLASTISGGAYKLLIWFLPLWLAIIVADDCIEDCKLGYKNLLVSKWGKNKYIRINLIKGFVISFLLLLIPLIVNLIMTQCIFAGGNYNDWDSESIRTIPSLAEEFKHPLLTNIEYILVASFISGVLGIGATAVALILNNRYVAYPVIFLMWYLPSVSAQPINEAFQPFTEYPMSYALPSVLFVVALNLAAGLVAYIKVVKYEKV